MKKWICMLFVAAFAFMPMAAEAYIFDVSAGFWTPEPTGGIAYSINGMSDSIDLAADLGFEEESLAQIRAKFDLPLLNVAVMATPLKYEGTGTMTQNVPFGGSNFLLDEPVTSSLDLNHTDVTLFWAVPGLSLATLNTVNVEFGLNARMLSVDTSIAGAITGTEVKSESATIPMLYLGVQLTPIDSLSLDVEYRGVSAGDNKYTDMMAKLKWSPLPMFYLSGGYRTATLELDEGGLMSDVEFKGPFAELGLKF